jgi:hypothetical protein
MILLDTNVLAEIGRPRPDPRVASWLNALPRATAWTTTVTIYEIRRGIEVLPAGRRRQELEELTSIVLASVVGERIAAFDEASARAAAICMAVRRRAGLAEDGADAMIAGIAQSRALPLATRNTSDFDGLDLTLVDPWQGAAAARGR